MYSDIATFYFIKKYSIRNKKFKANKVKEQNGLYEYLMIFPHTKAMRKKEKH